jgi:DHA1 family bicyclomycin/chloramphenicol resistance-like MFS transporter
MKQLPLPEFVALAAMLMALNALAVDIMLPALPMISETYRLTNANDQQLVIIGYLLGFGASQLVYGPLSDRFGRRPVLFVSLACYALAGLACVFAPSFEWLLAARAFQGVSAGGSRVIAVSAARDLYSGRAMARVMSLVMMVFMSAPILAPWFGQMLLKIVDWHGIFWSLSIFGAVMFTWVLTRLPETLPEDRRSPIDPASVLANYRQVASTRVTFGYTIASGLMFSAMMSYISSSEQIYHDVYHTGDMFPLWFAGAAFAMSGSNLINSRLVERLGMRRLSHAALIGLVVVCLIHFVIAMQGPVPFPVFYTLILIEFFMMGFQGPNYSAIAMEPLGRLAGSGAALMGFASSFVSATIGGLIARTFNGELTPILAGHVVVSTLALLAVVITEKGRLMDSRSHE